MGLWPQKWWPKSSLGSSAVREGNLALGTWVRVEGGGAWGLWGQAAVCGPVTRLSLEEEVFSCAEW